MPKVVKKFKIIVAIGIEGAAIMHVDEKTSHYFDMTEEQASKQCIPHDIECSGAEDWLESLNIGKVFPGIYCMEGKAMFDLLVLLLCRLASTAAQN